MKKIKSLCLAGVFFILMTSCILSIFDPNKLVEPTDLKPMVYIPIASETLKVKDYANNLPLGNAIISSARLDLKPVLYDLAGLKFDTPYIDSLVLIVKTVNETPMKLRYSLVYSGGPNIDSDTLKSALINQNGDVLEATSDSLEFSLNKAQVVSLGTSPVLNLNVSLFQPDKGPVVSSVLKNSSITFKIGCRGPVNLVKINL